MGRVWWIVVFASACYAPVPITGAPCATNGDCPEPLVCDRSGPESTCEQRIRDAGAADASDDAPDGAGDAASPPDSSVDAGLVLCLEDDFEDGNASDWTIVDPSWVVQAGAGPDNSVAFVAPLLTGDAIITHPAIRSIASARIALDLRIDSGAVGDFSIILAKPGWTDPNDDITHRYYASLYAAGSDSAPDRIAKRLPPAATVDLATHQVSVVASTWHHLDLLYRPDGSIRVDLDQTAYMESQPDSALVPPFDLVIRFWANGAIDNVRVECRH